MDEEVGLTFLSGDFVSVVVVFEIILEVKAEVNVGRASTFGSSNPLSTTVSPSK